MRPVAVLLATLASSWWITASSTAADRFTFERYARQPDTWFRSEEGRRVAANIRSHQSDQGSWPKNLDTAAHPFRGERATLKGTFDNGATLDELRFLARAFQAAADPADRAAFRKGLDYLLAAQYPNGGWPQSSPPGTGYPRHITFNDHAMVRILEFLREVAQDPRYEPVAADRRQAAQAAFDAGIACILKCQVVVAGQRTVWCAQHDEHTFEPRPARSFEPAALSGGESAGILRLLMSLDHPSPEIIAAIEAGARWYKQVKLTGIRQVVVNGDKKIVPDPNAPPLWARFYEIGTNRPIFSGRDSLLKYDLAEIEPERRNGYAWYGSWGQDVARQYARWKARRPNP